LTVHAQIRPYQRAHAQITADLSALIKYLLEAKDPEDEPGENHLRRLAGPPVTSRLVQRVSPFGPTISVAAYDLAQQLFNHARDRQMRGALPWEIYKYLFFSFPVHQPLNKKFLALTSMAAERQVGSDFQIIVRVVRELLDAMGIDEKAPSIIVVHDDTEHYHAHVVVGMFAAKVDCSAAFKALKPSLIKKINSALYAGNRWQFPSEALASEHNETPTPTDPGFRLGV
jgi:hypothetical protein